MAWTALPACPIDVRPARFVVVASFLLLFSSVAMADTLDDASAALGAGDRGEASRLLLDYLLEEDTDPEQVLEAVRLVIRLDDLDLIERALGRAEIAAGETDDPRLDLALGLSYLALADGRLRRGVQGPTLAMLFADAESRARKVMARPAWAAEGRVLLARTRHAGGDLPGAIAALEASSAAARERYWSGRLLYERALQRPAPTEASAADATRGDLQEALDHLEQASAEGLDGEEAFLARLTSAWITHRVAAYEPDDRETYIEAARQHYQDAWRLDPTSPLPLRGLGSLYANDPTRLATTLEAMLEERGDDKLLLDRLTRAWLDAGERVRAVLTLQRRLDLDAEDPAGWIGGARVLMELEQFKDAQRYLERALALAPTNREATALFDELARTVVAVDAEAGVAAYESLLAARPDDPYVRNNYGFILRELVSPHTAMVGDGVQELVPEAPPRIRELLERCRDVYAEAVALLPEEEDADLEEMQAWNLAGIVNDYGLVLHYFADIQDAPAAERQYLRALRMTDYGFKDTYLPNLRRLYASVLENRDLALYRVAREARDAILKEAVDPSGRLVLVADEEKRAIAAQDAEALRARIRAELDEDEAD